MIARIHELAHQARAEVVRLRRHLHAHPELSYEEHATGRYIAEQLRAIGIAVREGVAGTGVIGVVQGLPGDGCICLRADIDALPIHERNDAPYRSVNEGVMHACGHDAHSAMVLGAGAILHALRAEWKGTVLLLFQPGEEKIPGGATLVLQEDALREPRPSVILGQHVTPELAAGKVGFREGPFMASSDELYVTVKGRGGHAAAPDKLIDPILIAARLLLTLKEDFAAFRPEEPKLLGFGQVIANGATNVVPDEVHIAGTLRAFDEPLRAELHTWLPRRANEICSAFGGSCDFEVHRGYPVLVNDAAVTARMKANAEAYLGAENVVRMDRRMGSEDFAFYTHAMPGCFYRLGTGMQEGHGGLHTPTFELDEDALRIGSGLMAWNAISELKG